MLHLSQIIHNIFNSLVVTFVQTHSLVKILDF